jgi:hypothetical protein
MASSFFYAIAVWFEGIGEMLNIAMRMRKHQALSRGIPGHMIVIMFIVVE